MILGKEEENTLGDGCGVGEAGVFHQGGSRGFGNGGDLNFSLEETGCRAPPSIFWRKWVVAKHRDF